MPMSDEELHITLLEILGFLILQLIKKELVGHGNKNIESNIENCREASFSQLVVSFSFNIHVICCFLYRHLTQM